MWLANSPDLNSVEQIGKEVKHRVDEKCTLFVALVVIQLNFEGATWRRSNNFEFCDDVFDNNHDLAFENANFQATSDFNTFPLKPTNRYCICRVDLIGHDRDNARTCDYCKLKCLTLYFSDGELLILHNKKYIPACCKFGDDYCVERISDCVSSPHPSSVLSLEKSRSINDYLSLVDMIDNANYQTDQTCCDFDVETFSNSQSQVVDDDNVGRSEDFNDIFDWPLGNLDSVLVTPIKSSKTDKTDDESGWSESNDRCLFEELHKFSGDIRRASIQAARILNISFEMVQGRMEMLVEMLENADV
uniref:UBR-type domain-containing protein n=1 Tax=Romanomermis culicivorax TaxID=13658 RepID=A0A915JUT9_ROMCU